ncbi:MAG TPA: XdhC family protein [Jatrophihabitans sp.]|nr:XdhC family protein [Jatrophihabitans sp.]
MTARSDERMSRLAAARVPFVHAVVVRAQFPTSAKAGDHAIILGDGSIDGFVGGQCAEASVRTAALETLRTGEPVLLRVLPEGDDSFPTTYGAQVVVNSCLSGGALEIFLEPRLPPPIVTVVGDTPVADALVTMIDVLGYTAQRTTAVPRDASAVIVASHGRDELPALRAALDADVPYIALVASRRRGRSVLDELGVDEAARARISTPAGLDIGARTAPEVALSILAEVIPVVRSVKPAEVVDSAAPVEAVDPVCGMTVATGPAAVHVSADGVDVWFCSTHCRDRYAAPDGQPA